MDGSERRAALWVFIAFASLYLLTMKGIQMADGVLHFDLAQGILSAGRFDVSDGWDPDRPGMHVFVARGRDGKVYSVLPHGLAIASLPLGGIGRLVESWGESATEHPDPLAQKGDEGMRRAMAELRHRPSALLSAAINPLATAATVALFFLLAVELIGPPRDALRAALLLGLATVAWPYSTNYWTQPLAGLCLLAALYSLGRGEPLGWRHASLGGLAIGVGVLCRYEVVLLAPWLLLYSLLRTPGGSSRRWLNGLGFLGGLGPAILTQALWNAFRFGSFLDTGTGHQRWRDFQGDILQVLPLQIVSPYRGILFYSPPLILGVVGFAFLWRRRTTLAVTLAGLSITLLVFYSAFLLWRSDGTWGPRFLVPLTPILLLPATYVIRRWPPAFWATLIIGFAFQLPAALGLQDMSVLNAYHSPMMRDPWQHFWQTDVLAQWRFVTQGNIELWWLTSLPRALLGLVIGCCGVWAGREAARATGSAETRA